MISDSDPINNSIPEPREEVKNIKSYSAPLEDRRTLLRLDFNENTIGPSIKVYDALQQIKINEVSIYPEYNLLKEKISNNYLKNKKISSEELGLFNGADAAINAIFNAFGKKNDYFLTTDPTFGYYSPCAEMQGMKILKSTYKNKNFQFPIKDFEKKIINYKPKLIFICNPNNPTGTILSAEEVIRLSQLNKNSLLVVDELYEKFNGDTLLKNINFDISKNIVVIQSLSKTGGLAGLRIGFAFGNKKIIEYINRVTGPYDVNSFAVNAAIAALDDLEYIDNYAQKVKEARKWIQSKFESTNIRSHFAGGNYFLIWPNKNPEIIEEEMRKKGILIRNMSSKKDLEYSIRVSIGTKEQMKLFWEAYQEIDLKS